MRALASAVVVCIGCSSGPSLSTLEQDSVVVSPSAHDFGTVSVGDTSPSFAVEVDPDAGANDDMVTAVTASCPDFAISATGLPAHVFRTCKHPGGNCQTKDYQTYTFATAFHPTVQGVVSCVVTIALASGANRTVTLTGTGVPPPIQIDVQPGSIAFGDVRVNTDSSPAPLSIASTGSQPLSVSSVSIGAGFAIASGPTTAFQIQPGTSQPYTLVCHPTSTGMMTGAFAVASNDPAHPMVTVPLNCNGIASNLDVQPSPATLPTTRVGEPVDLAIELENTGGASMTVESVAVTGAGFTMTSGPANGTVLAGGASAPVDVHFDAANPGDAAGMLVTTYDGGQTRTTPIAARALATSMSLSPDGTVDLGPVCVGQSTQQPFVVMANQPGAFVVTAIDDPPAPFSVAKPALPAHVAGSGGDRVMFAVTAAPTTAGPATGSFAITTDIPGAMPHAIDLATLGLPAGVSATPDSVDLGSHAVDTTSIAQMVTVTNCTAGAITATAEITGADASEFAIVQAPDAAIPETGNASWLVVLEPHSVGLKHAELAIVVGSQTLTVPLDGEGLGTDGGDKSYYSCSTGRPTAWWPILLAFAALGAAKRNAVRIRRGP